MTDDKSDMIAFYPDNHLVLSENLITRKLIVHLGEPGGTLELGDHELVYEVLDLRGKGRFTLTKRSVIVHVFVDAKKTRIRIEQIEHALQTLPAPEPPRDWQGQVWRNIELERIEHARKLQLRKRSLYATLITISTVVIALAFVTHLMIRGREHENSNRRLVACCSARSDKRARVLHLQSIQT